MYTYELMLYEMILLLLVRLRCITSRGFILQPRAPLLSRDDSTSQTQTQL